MRKPLARSEPSPHVPEVPFPPRPGPRRFTPETIAKAAVARRPLAPSGRVIVALKLFLSREIAEAITARALHEGKSVPALVGELIEAEVRRPRERAAASRR